MIGIGMVVELPLKQKFKVIGSVIPFDKNTEYPTGFISNSCFLHPSLHLFFFENFVIFAFDFVDFLALLN
jgi:hypothetical protein